MWQLLPGAAVAGARAEALQLPVLIRIILSEVPSARAGVGSGVMATTQQSALAVGVATLGTLSCPSPRARACGTAVTTLLVQLAGVALTTALSLRLPRTIS